MNTKQSHSCSFLLFVAVYLRQQNKCYPQRFQIVRKIAVNCSTYPVMKFDCSNKFDFCYYGQVNSQLLKSRVASKGNIVSTFRGNIYFAGDGTLVNIFKRNSLDEIIYSIIYIYDIYIYIYIYIYNSALVQ